MHLNYYFLRQLSAALSTQLEGLTLVSCFSQNKDEVVFGWATTEKYFCIRALLSSDICCLSFPDDYRRSRNNSVDLFQGIIGYEVKRVRQFVNERAFAIYLYPNSTTATEDENSTPTPKILLFKLHGQRSNILLFEQNTEENPDNTALYVATELFRNHLDKDWDLRIEHIDRPIPQNADYFEQHGAFKTFPTFEKGFWEFIGKKSDAAHFSDIEPVLHYLENPTYYVRIKGDEVDFSLFPTPATATDIITHSYTAPITAANEFYRFFSRRYYFEGEKARICKKIDTKIKQTESYIQKTEEKLLEVEYKTPYEQYANIIMANLHELPKQPLPVAQQVELYDFYNNTPLTIRLREGLTPQKSAEVYYRKSKNQKIEIDKLYKNLEEKQDLLKTLQQHLQAIGELTDFRALKKYLKEFELFDEGEEELQYLFRRFEYQGFEIWVGKSAKNNDLLTQRYAYKEDLWLHAKDVAGSHVIVKYQAGKKFPYPVIEKAAQLAAYYSKRKNDTLCPVTYTPKKFVRKPKGFAEGMVKVDKEQVLLVAPTEAMADLRED